MTKLRKVLFISVLALFALIIGAIQLTVGWRPFLGPRKRALTNRKFEATPERVARGRYLAQGLLGCGVCHTPRDWTKHGAPAIAGKEFAGQAFELPGFPGHPVAPNLTSDPETGAAQWTDDQIARAIREGIKHDDTTLFPLMPYMIYANMSDEDLASVVVYLRSLPAVRNPLPPNQVNSPVNRLVNGVPKPIFQPVHAPNLSDSVARGKYLVSIGCGCHDAVDKLPYGGGEKLVGPWGDVTSPNITPDASGISYYNEATFITAMRSGYVGAHHAISGISEPHRRRSEGHVCLSEDPAAGEASRRQFASAHKVQAMQAEAWRGGSELERSGRPACGLKLRLPMTFEWC